MKLRLLKSDPKLKREFDYYNKKFFGGSLDAAVIFSKNLAKKKNGEEVMARVCLGPWKNKPVAIFKTKVQADAAIHFLNRQSPKYDYDYVEYSKNRFAFIRYPYIVLNTNLENLRVIRASLLHEMIHLKNPLDKGHGKLFDKTVKNLLKHREIRYLVL